MRQRKKHRISMRPPKATGTKARGAWKFAGVSIAILVLLAVALNRPRRNPTDRPQVKSDSNTPVALKTGATDTSPKSPDTVKTTEDDPNAIDRATELANRGTALLA